MVSERKQTTLDEIAEIEMGQSPSGKACNKNGVGQPLLNGPTEFGEYNPTPVQFTIDPRKFSQPYDILFCVRGSTTGRMNWADQKYAIGRGIAAIRHRNGPDYRYFLKGLIEYHLSELLASATGSTFPNVSRDQLAKIHCKIPSLPEQRAIADVLGALDDKIKLNRRMSVTLEEMAMAVFKAWFSENEDAISWKVVPLPEMIDVNPTRSLKKGVIVPYLDMANMPTQGHRAVEWINRPFGSGTKFINGDTLLARITPCLENGKTAFVDFLEDDQVGWGSTEYIILRPKPPLPVEFGYFLARSDELRNHTIQNMTGTSGRQRAPAACFDKYMLAVPPEALARRFGEFAKDVMAKIRANDQQSRTLAALRDTLLPRLMSGEVTVKDWEKEL